MGGHEWLVPPVTVEVSWQQAMSRECLQAPLVVSTAGGCVVNGGWGLPAAASGHVGRAGSDHPQKAAVALPVANLGGALAPPVPLLHITYVGGKCASGCVELMETWTRQLNQCREGSHLSGKGLAWLTSPAGISRKHNPDEDSELLFCSCPAPR